MRPNTGGLKRRRARCPECAHTFSIRFNPDIRRFKAPLQRCPECDHVARRGAFPEPDLEGYWHDETDGGLDE